MEQNITTSVNDLAQAFSIAFRQEFQPLKQELQTLAANSTSQHLDNGTGTSRIACEGDSMANIKRKYTINGEGVWIQGKSEQEILEKACALMGAQTRPAPAAKHNFRAYALDWFKNFSLPNVEQVTAITYKRELDLHIFPAFGKMNIEDITLSDVQALFNRKGAKKESLMKTRTVLNQIFRKAIDDDLMRKNPLQAFSFRLTGEASDTTQPYSVEEMRLMVERIGRLTNPNDIAYLAVATMQPLRLEETLGLQWQDVDCQAMALHIRRAVTHPDRNAPIVKETKTQEKRDVALTKTTLHYLDSIPQGAPTDFVVGGKVPFSYTQVRRMCQRIARQIDFPGKITPQRFRTTVLTDIYDQTRDIKLTQAAAGHKTADMTLKHYVKCRQINQASASAIDAVYGNEN